MENIAMTVKKIYLPALLVLFGFVGNASALENIARNVQEGCASEIEKYCSEVSPGEGRLLSCFYAHESKLSGRCEHALYQASAKLKQAAVALNYVAEQCQKDILSHCADVPMGEGRVVACLKSNADSISDGCKAAMSDVFK